jgi:hypothetical protein
MNIRWENRNKTATLASVNLRTVFSDDIMVARGPRRTDKLALGMGLKKWAKHKVSSAQETRVSQSGFETRLAIDKR